jgi:L-seryl-tRNA(Ser) seleniumtransferase
MSDLSALPRIDALLEAGVDLVARFGRAPATEALRRAVDGARAELLAGAEDVRADADGLLAAAREDLATRRPGPPRRVINATGVVLHTNLGRAPLSEAACAAVGEAAGACDLEYDLATGARGSRGARLEPLLAEATGAAAAIAVNNAAAALVLVLGALARGRDVLVSRGELVEIGGSFRLPDIMAASGARLVEVGTTNKTRATDFADAGDDVALILKVHPSNYRITGFTEDAPVGALAEVAARRGVPLVHDVGSGLLHDRHERWLDGEPSMGGSLAAGADLVLCSGDKLLGGPQAGILAGRADLVAACRRHPLTRALRLDKLRIAALVVTLEQHLRGDLRAVPTWRMLEADSDAIGVRADALARALDGTVEAGTSLVGGGSAPDRAVPSRVVRVPVEHPDRVAAALRAGAPPIVVRVEGAAIWVDPRTVDPIDDGALLDQLTAVVRG